MAKIEGDIKVSGKFKAAVKVKITEEEIHEKESKIRKNLSKIAHLQEEMRPTKEKIKALNEEKNQLRLDAETGTEERELYVVNEFNFKKKQVRVLRADTREEVEKRPLSEEERQTEFSDLLGGPGKGDDGESEEEEPN